MKILRFALGARFEAQGMEEEPAFIRACLDAFLEALAPKDLAGLQLYAGTDAVTEPDRPALIVVVMGGSLKRTRRVFQKLQPGLCGRLCENRPFIESNRVARLEGLAYYGQFQGDGRLCGGDALGTVRPQKSKQTSGAGR